MLHLSLILALCVRACVRACVWGGSCDIFEACNAVMSMSPRNHYTASCNSGNGSGGVEVSYALIDLPCLPLPANVFVYDAEYIYALTHAFLVKDTNTPQHTHNMTHTHTHTHTQRMHTYTNTHMHTYTRTQEHTHTHKHTRNTHLHTHLLCLSLHVYIYIFIFVYI